MKVSFVDKNYVDSIEKPIKLGYFNEVNGYCKVGIKPAGDKALLFIYGINAASAPIVSAISVRWDGDNVYFSTENIVGNIEVFYAKHEGDIVAIAFRMNSGYCSYTISSTHSIYAHYSSY